MPAQEISDTIALRKRIQDCFELAALPGTPEADIRKALHFIVVGGGPTVRPPTCCRHVQVLHKVMDLLDALRGE